MSGDGSDDVVLWLLRALCDRAKLPTNAVIEVERDARIHWGGRRCYISKTAPEERLQCGTRRGRADVA